VVNEAGSVEEVNTVEALPLISGNRILARVHNENLWEYKKEDGSSTASLEERIKNPGRVLEIVREEIQNAENKGTNSPKEIQLPELTELQRMAAEGVNKFASNAVKEGWLPSGMIMLTSKLTRGSDIKVVDEAHGALNFEGDSQGRPDISVSTSIVKNRAELYYSTAKLQGIDITSEQAIRAAVYSVGIHEWAHSIERSIERQCLSIAKQLPEYQAKQDDYLFDLKVQHKAGELVFNEAKTISLPLIQLNNEADNQMVHNERFATGFEQEGVLLGLKSSGVSSENAEIIIKEVIENGAESLKDFKKLREGLNMGDVEINDYFLDIRDLIKKNGMDETYIPFLWDGIGYLGGYNKEQLGNMVTAAMSKLDDESVRQGVKAAALETDNPSWNITAP